jgi:hypothetical protein
VLRMEAGVGVGEKSSKIEKPVGGLKMKWYEE